MSPPSSAGSVTSAGASLSGDFSFIPEHPSFENYRAILLDEPFLLWLKNSLLLSAGTVLVAMLCAVTAAYACSRWRFSSSACFCMASSLAANPLIFCGLFLFS